MTYLIIGILAVVAFWSWTRLKFWKWSAKGRLSVIEVQRRTIENQNAEIATWQRKAGYRSVPYNPKFKDEWPEELDEEKYH